LSAGSYVAPGQRLARRIARWTAQCVERLPRRRARFDTGLAAGPTARSWRFGGSSDALADGLDRDGPGVLPDGSLAVLRRMVRDASADGSRRARHTARRLACGASADGSRRFGGWLRWARRTDRRLACGALADGSRRFGGWFEMGPAYCPTARSWRFGRSSDASADGLDRDGPGVLPDGSLAALRRIRRLPNGSRDNCITGKIR